MKKTLKRIEKYRVTTGPMASSAKDGRNGAFLLPPDFFGYRRDLYPHAKHAILIISDGSDWDKESMGDIAWEHASLSFHDRTPSWAEMCRIKDLLWDEGETVIQFHPAKSSYVNNHKFCLHLWKPVSEFPVPPTQCV